MGRTKTASKIGFSKECPYKLAMGTVIQGMEPRSCLASSAVQSGVVTSWCSNTQCRVLHAYESMRKSAAP
uniref:Uncharacterized protein n=1 Tax=Triticum urartu TaxID=4572 RepID=A0A8R7U6W0_TRIUA